MKVLLSQSGGLGNIRIQGELETADLPRELAQKTERVLRPETLQRASSTDSSTSPDAQEFELNVWFNKEGFQHYRIDDSSAPPEVLEVLDSLIHEIIRRRSQGRK
jgi:hypothetical protein